MKRKMCLIKLSFPFYLGEIFILLGCVSLVNDSLLRYMYFFCCDHLNGCDSSMNLSS